MTVRFRDDRAEDNVWLVTGSLRGLGRAITEALLASGHRVVATAREPTVGKMVRFHRNHNGRQPGDPARAAEVIAVIARLQHLPLRLLLGTGAVVAAETADKSRTASDQIWRHLGVSTDVAPQCQGDGHD